ncbi:MAG: protein kinase [Desulfopila sp.]|jgi:serine/threonine-protein kinase|nr:protein kinase [Desulfopila sp.]
MKKIGRYSIHGRLGRGGMSTVYKAKASITARTVALKVLLPRDDIFIDLVGLKRLKEIFIEEARIMGEISHDHVAKIIDCDEDNGAPFIVLEYFAHSIGSLIGESYQLEKPSRIISTNKAFEYLRQTLFGLERLHFAGIVHRDIKPYNLMITTDDRIKIIDFGLSRVRGEEKMAIPGMQVGSPYYAAPEQERTPEKADERSDLFSVAVLACRLLTGQLPNHRLQEQALPSSLNSELNSDWDAFLLRASSPQQAERYESARDMRLALEEIHAAWARHTKKSCTFVAFDQSSPSLPQKVLRRSPIFIQRKNLQRSLDLDDLMRPRVYPPHRFEILSHSLIACLDTGLIWQREGAGFMLTWSKAHEYVAYLNSNTWQGFSDWRLPSLEELSSLLLPEARLRDFCFASYFSSKVHWLWSCDTSTKQKAWLVDIVENYYGDLDKDGMASVCAVVGPNFS